ncbi:hypothetical protein J7I98_23775 [Streptomyces sp. ISL-98]|uniref:hypothetical protein n=1 Tax=Streptomyces sp. ISL-98 TaxID=2819192 RepID=UPI001BEA0BE7|nr:hypothetical protein [Streptomyces sp. ISL-98]MBT2508850.1 hypothetical protein [Streptomyces sp. ISL-98]
MTTTDRTNRTPKQRERRLMTRWTPPHQARTIPARIPAICPATGEPPIRTASLAQTESVDAGLLGIAQVPAFCDHCGGWHLTEPTDD